MQKSELRLHSYQYLMYIYNKQFSYFKQFIAKRYTFHFLHIHIYPILYIINK